MRRFDDILFEIYSASARSPRVDQIELDGCIRKYALLFHGGISLAVQDEEEKEGKFIGAPGTDRDAHE